MIASNKNNWAMYWRIVVLTGVAMNLVVGIPALFIPGTILGWIGLPLEDTPDLAPSLRGVKNAFQSWQ